MCPPANSLTSFAGLSYIQTHKTTQRRVQETQQGFPVGSVSQCKQRKQRAAQCALLRCMLPAPYACIMLHAPCTACMHQRYTIACSLHRGMHQRYTINYYTNSHAAGSSNSQQVPCVKRIVFTASLLHSETPPPRHTPRRCPSRSFSGAWRHLGPTTGQGVHARSGIQGDPGASVSCLHGEAQEESPGVGARCSASDVRLGALPELHREEGAREGRQSGMRHIARLRRVVPYSLTEVHSSLFMRAFSSTALPSLYCRCPRVRRTRAHEHMRV